MFDAINIARMAHIQNAELTDKETTNEKPNILQRFLANKIFRLLSLPSINTRSLFIFSEENLIRKYARMIIEWGYPLKIFFTYICCSLSFVSKHNN